MRAAATGSGQKNGLASTAAQSHRVRSIGMRAHLHQRAADRDTSQHAPGNGTRGDPHGSFPGRGSPAAAVVTDAVFQVW